MKRAGAFSYALAVVLTTSSALLIVRPPRARDAPPMWRRLGLSEESWRRVHGVAAHFLTRARELTRLPVHTLFALAGATLAHIPARLAPLPLLRTLLGGVVLALAGAPRGMERPA